MEHLLYIGCRCVLGPRVIEESRLKHETSVISSRVSLDLQSSSCNITRFTLKHLQKKKSVPRFKICSLIDMRLNLFREGISFCPMGEYQVQIDI